MPRRQTTPKKLSHEIPPALRTYLESGERVLGDALPFSLEGNPAALRAAWQECRAIIMRDWIRRHPCTRPAMWWTFDAPTEPVPGCDGFSAAQRHRIGGTGQPQHEIIAIAPCFDCGIPVSWFDQEGAEAFGGIAVDETDPPRFESEANYLDRHGLLTPAEVKYLASHPEALEPEAITFEEDEAPAIALTA